MDVSKGRVIVTGATRGIGRAVAVAILARGGRVIAVGRDRQRLDALVEGAADRLVPLEAALEDTDQLGGIVQSAVDAFGGIDGLVNCAGIAQYARVGAIERESIDQQLRVNLVAPLVLTQLVAAAFGNDGGAIVNVSSTLSLHGVEGTAVYAATKAALNSITQTLALELAPRQIRVNAVLPGVVDTDMVRAPRLRPGEPAPTGPELQARVDAQLEALRVRHPLGRLGTPGDVAQVIVDLLDRPWQTGSLVTIDGGLSVAWG